MPARELLQAPKRCLPVSFVCVRGIESRIAVSVALVLASATAGEPRRRNSGDPDLPAKNSSSRILPVSHRSDSRTVLVDFRTGVEGFVHALPPPAIVARGAPLKLLMWCACCVFSPPCTHTHNQCIPLSPSRLQGAAGALLLPSWSICSAPHQKPEALCTTNSVNASVMLHLSLGVKFKQQLRSSAVAVLLRFFLRGPEIKPLSSNSTPLFFYFVVHLNSEP